jgi:hypothetical protein
MPSAQRLESPPGSATATNSAPWYVKKNSTKKAPKYNPLSAKKMMERSAADAAKLGYKKPSDQASYAAARPVTKMLMIAPMQLVGRVFMAVPFILCAWVRARWKYGC